MMGARSNEIFITTPRNFMAPKQRNTLTDSTQKGSVELMMYVHQGTVKNVLMF